MDVVISVPDADGQDTLESLADWLRGDPQLAGLVRVRQQAPQPGQLGTLMDALVVSVGAGGTLTALVSMLRAWLLRPRQAHIKLKLQTGKDGRHIVELDADRIKPAELDALLARLTAENTGEGRD